MNSKPKPYVIACGVMGRDLRKISADMGIAMALRCLPGGLHETPDLLRSKLQAIINEVSDPQKWSRIVLGYGTCGCGTVDLKAGAIPLIIPKVHDCIALFLGGNQAYQKEFKRYPGTYYISPGWYEEKSVPASQQQSMISAGDRKFSHDELVDLVGEQGARQTIDFFNSWKQNYQRAVFIDTAATGQGRAAAHARRMAEENGWRYETITGDMRLLSKLLTIEQEDHEVLVVPPGQVTYFDAASEELCAKPVHRCRPNAQDRKGARQWWVGNSPAPTASPGLGLGIDAGGTYTDAVIFDFKDSRVVAKHKALTTRWDFSEGIGKALEGLTPSLLEHVDLVTVSTTLATNAMVEGEGQPVGLMLMAPAGILPIDRIDHRPTVLLNGCLSITGRILSPMDENQIREAAQCMIRQHGVAAFAVSGYAGHINPEHEIRVKQILRSETGCVVCCGHELSDRLNFMVRAQTAVLNARIIPQLGKLMAEVRHLLDKLSIMAPVMVVKGDGSLMADKMAVERPVETILSGPAASTSGARFLTQCRDAVVVDIGGTTTDTARIAGHTVAICETGAFVGGFHTHVKALDIRTTGLGGDSHIVLHEDGFRVGPKRVTPISWLTSAGLAVESALQYLEQRRPPARRSTKGYTLLALVPEALPEKLTAEEQRLVDLLRSGPLSILELTERTDALHPDSLPLNRLLSCHALYRCALTPTDLLQAAQELDLWDRDTAVRASALTAKLAGLSVEALCRTIRNQMTRAMAIDILKLHLDQGQNPEAIDNCPVCRQLIANSFNKHAGPVQARYRLASPIIGIGAPAGFFLPQVARLLETELLLPPDQDVANAIGAVTSKVEIKRQSIIKPDAQGGYFVEGLKGRKRFATLDEAQEAAVDQLLADVRRIGAAAGTSNKAVCFERRDHTTRTAQHNEIFLERVISAVLSGPPDCASPEPSSSSNLGPLYSTTL